MVSGYSGGKGVYITDSKYIYINNSYFDSYVDTLIQDTNDLIMENNYFTGTEGIKFQLICFNNTFKNNTFSDLSYAIHCSELSNVNYGIYNFFYFNIFSNNGKHFYSCDENNVLNISVNGYAQGNQYSDFCDKGTDLNNDTYADNDTSAGTDDWPYNATTTSKIVGFAGVGGPTDFGPKIYACPAEDVFLTSSTNNAGSRSSSDTASAAAAPAPAPSQSATLGKTTEVPEAPITVDQSKTEVTAVEGKTVLTMVVTNNGPDPLDLLAQLNDKLEDNWLILTTKTLGYEDSLSNGITYPGKPILGNYLKAFMKESSYTLEPGETRELTFEIDNPKLMTEKKTISVVLKSADQTFAEQEVNLEAPVTTLSAVDVQSNDDLVDVYVLIADSNGGALSNNELYYFELSINSKEDPNLPWWKKLFKGEKTLFNDMYGPYNIPKGQSFIFGQQLKYNPEIYNGEYKIIGKVYKKDKVLVENEFPVVLE
jgi:hypothetical protein